MKSKAGELSNEAEPSPRLIYERELLFGEAIETVAALLESQGISQRELAERMGRSEARVSRILNGGENTTLKTIADLGYALGIRFTCVPIPFADRSGTPAADDPPAPAWIARQRRSRAGSPLSEVPDQLGDGR
jgi:transcriptional regulator with XRE-family HTH domain